MLGQRRGMKWKWWLPLDQHIAHGASIGYSMDLRYFNAMGVWHAANHELLLYVDKMNIVMISAIGHCPAHV